MPVETDSLRLQLVNEVLVEGRRLDLLADSLCRDFAGMRRLSELHAGLARAGRRRQAVVIEEQELEVPGRPSWRRRLKNLHQLASVRFLDEEACRALERDVMPLIEEEAESAGADLFMQDSLERASRREALERKIRLEAVRLPDPASIARCLGQIDQLWSELPQLVEQLSALPLVDDPRFGLVHHADSLLLVGSRADNRYEGNLPPIVIDLGGDDRYGAAAASSRGRLSLLIDLAGDDLYRGNGETGPAQTLGGLSVLLELEGDDHYQGDFRTQAAALGGVALLLDSEGQDSYQAGLFCQAAAILGQAALVDGGGDDLYLASLYAQGFGHVGAAALLQDMDGHDQYILRPRFLDVIRYEDHHLTLGQGFGFGSRPDLSGGFGLLHDLAGNDSYSADIYGQGAAYWWALGALVDRAGNDRYTAWQYAQGAGIHLAAGLLLDQAGQDVYVSRGVSQGCGHDLALGMLLDQAGDDSYLAWDLSQGAGSANGTGLLLDEAGNDLYAMRGMRKHRAYGDPRRRTGSLGLFADLDGLDHYLGHGGEDSLWVESFRGTGLDEDRPAQLLEEPLAEAEPVAGLRADFDSTANLDRLYVWAIRLEPRYAAESRIARRVIARQPEAFLDFLQKEKLLASRISWERHAIKNLLKEMDEAILPLCKQVMQQPVPLDTDSLKELRRAQGMVLWTLGEMPQTASAGLFLDWLTELDGPDVDGLKASLLENIALRLDQLEEREQIEQTLLLATTAESASVRRSACWGLSRLPSTSLLRASFMDQLADPAWPVRLAAWKALEADSLLGSQDLLIELSAATRPVSVQRELLRLLIERDQAAARDWLEKQAPTDWFWERLLLSPGEAE